MQPVYITDPAWWTTFRHLVEPLPDEWLAGLLLRCDEVNRWAAGTTFVLFRRAIKWQGNLEPHLTVPSIVNLSFLAQHLALSINDLLSTTYLPELARCYEIPQPHFKLLSTSYQFSFCPLCLAQNRKLQRKFLLPHITCCPEHHTILLETCSCGRGPNLFSQLAQPFTCTRCGLDWARLPRLQAEPKRILFEQRVLSYYEFFFFRGTQAILERALHLVIPKLAEKESEYLGPISRFRYVPRSYRSRCIRNETSYHVKGGTVSINYRRGRIVLGDLVGLLAEFELSPFQLIDDA